MAIRTGGIYALWSVPSGDEESWSSYCDEVVDGRSLRRVLHQANLQDC
jgi:hypothetical protein